MKLAFSSSSGNTVDVSIINIDGSELIKLTTHPANDELPKWSPDGSRIVFRSTIAKSDQIHIMNADGTNVKAITDTPGKHMPYEWKLIPSM